MASETDALHDVYEGRRDEIGALSRARCRACDAQVGALAAIGGRFVVLDHVSEPVGMGRAARPDRAGLRARRAGDRPAARARPRSEDAQDFLDLLLRAPLQTGPTIGLGESVRFDFGGLAGSGVAVEGELVALTAFAG